MVQGGERMRREGGGERVGEGGRKGKKGGREVQEGDRGEGKSEIKREEGDGKWRDREEKD